jgi:hypothetical protein
MNSHESEEPLDKDIEEVNPLTSIIYNKKNRSNISVISNMLERKSFSVYMYPNIYKSFAEYSKFTGKTTAECHEAALLEFMRNNPVSQVTLQVTKSWSADLPNLADKIKMKIIKNNLSDYLELMKRLHQIGNESNIKEHLPEFQKVIEKSLRVKNRDKELTELLRQSEEYL